MDHEYLVSYFNNIKGKKTKDIYLTQVLNEIREEVHYKKIIKIRNETDIEKRKLLKRTCQLLLLLV